MSARCRSCQAPIVWAKTLTGANMPVDPVPDPGGNMILAAIDPSDPEGGYAVIMVSGLTDAARDAADRVGVLFHQSHFATCPQAAQHRRRG